MIHRLTRSALLLAALSLLPHCAFAQESRRWKDAELLPVGKSLAGYVEARETGLGIDKARSELAKAMDQLRRSSDGIDLLRQPNDLRRTVALSRDLSRVAISKGKVSQDVFTDCSLAGSGLGFAYQVPKDYDPTQRVYPLILAIPDAGETPAEHIRANWISREVQDGAILVAVQMPTDQAEWSRVAVNGRPGGLSYVLTGLRMATERFAIDYDRVYVVGRGKGVPAAIAAGNYSPQRFAGILGRTGDAGEIGPLNFSNLPTWFAGAGARASEFQEAARAAGFDNCELQPGGSEKDLWAWVQKHPRVVNPASVTVAPGDPFPTRAYWLRVSPSASNARARGTLDRGKNEITILAEGISNVTVYLNDALLDLDKPVKIVCNGIERTLAVKRHLQDTLDLLIEGTSDAGAVYVAQAIVPTVAAAANAGGAAALPADPEFERMLLTAGNQADKLWEVHQWCVSTQRDALDRRVLLRLVRVAPEREDARAALGHRFSKEQWFTTQAALGRFERNQDPEVAARSGLIQFKSLWIHPEERALVGKGWIKEQETGLWDTPADRKRLGEGWARQDLDWIAPEETGRMDEGLWKVGGEWVDLATANERHARIDSMWRIPSADVLLDSTADRATCAKALATMSRAMEDLRKVFGAQPPLPLRVALLRDEEQYDRFAFGDPDGRRRADHAGRMHVVHHAFFGESWFPRVEGKLEFSGMGVGYWDALVPDGNLFGVHSARLALGLSYVEALDPSPKAVRGALSNGPQAGYYAAYQAEKLMPAWLRWGGAVYAERFFRDDTVTSDGDPWWARKWSIERIQRGGGTLQPLSEILACEFNPEDRDAALKLMVETGLVVSFIVDGECAEVQAAHDELKRALAAGKLHPSDISALTEALVEHESEFKAFAQQ